VEWWYAVVTTAGTSTVTVAATGGLSFFAARSKILAVSGATIELDTSATQLNGTNTTAHPCAPVGEIDTAADVIVLATCTTSANTGTVTAPSGFTLRATMLANRSFVWTRESTSALTDERAQWTSTSSIQSLGSVVSFKAVTPGGGGGITLISDWW
jgi:hypothetical protein